MSTVKELEVSYLNNKGEKVVRPLFEIIWKNDVWNKGGIRIISYDGCKRLADFCGVVIKETPMLHCSPTTWNRQQHIWGIRLGFADQNSRDTRVFSEWEASLLNTWTLVKDEASWKQRVSEYGSIDAKYKSAMAYKRAYCKWIIRLLWLTGVYSDIEASDFQKPSSWKDDDFVDYNSL